MSSIFKIPYFDTQRTQTIIYLYCLLPVKSDTIVAASNIKYSLLLPPHQQLAMVPTPPQPPSMDPQNQQPGAVAMDCWMQDVVCRMEMYTICISDGQRRRFKFS